MIRVRVGEEQVELSLTQLCRDRGLFLRDLFGQLRVAGSQLVQLDEIACALLQLLPGLDQITILGRLARERACAARVVPDSGLR